MNRTQIISFFGLIVVNLLTASCAYKWGYGDRALPGGYHEVSIPVFENDSKEVGVEMDFTRSLVERFNRSHVALVTEKGRAPLVVRGAITSIKVERGLGASRIDGKLPSRAVLNTEYVLTVNTKMDLIRESDQKVLWSSTFSKSKVYLAPRIGTAVVNSANATYNHSKRRETLRAIADEQMQEAHDRMTESF